MRKGIDGDTCARLVNELGSLEKASNVTGEAKNNIQRKIKLAGWVKKYVKVIKNV